MVQYSKPPDPMRAHILCRAGNNIVEILCWSASYVVLLTILERSYVGAYPLSSWLQYCRNPLLERVLCRAAYNIVEILCWRLSAVSLGTISYAVGIARSYKYHRAPSGTNVTPSRCHGSPSSSSKRMFGFDRISNETC
jgi:hypothetical protein